MYINTSLIIWEHLLLKKNLKTEMNRNYVLHVIGLNQLEIYNNTWFVHSFFFLMPLLFVITTKIVSKAAD